MSDSVPANDHGSDGVELSEILSQAARDSSEAIYLKFRDTALSFSELNRTLSQSASQLPPLSGLRAIILLPDGLGAAVAHLECQRQGATIIPLSPFSPATTVQHVVERIQADLVFTTPVLNAKFADVLKNTAIVHVGSDNTFTLKTAGSVPIGKRQRSQVRAVFFTSGTTGKPKGVCLSEHNLLSAASINRTILDLIQHDDR